MVSSPGNQHPGLEPAGEADDLPGVPAPGQHYHPPSSSFRQAGGQPHPPADGRPPPQVQGVPSQHQPQPPGQWDHSSWQQPSWHSSHASMGQPPQPPLQQSHQDLGGGSSSSLPPPPPLSGYSQPSIGLRDGGRSPSLQQQDSVPSPRAGQYEGSPSPSPSPAGRHSPSPGEPASSSATALQAEPPCIFAAGGSENPFPSQ